ncbi:hypothetical protein GF386_00465 [Candidatus Pacearchaeota archaeon]|nr:hypothetical protein [Candidatus Pacearchaeota archaeon]
MEKDLETTVNYEETTWEKFSRRFIQGVVAAETTALGFKGIASYMELIHSNKDYIIENSSDSEFYWLLQLGIPSLVSVILYLAITKLTKGYGNIIYNSRKRDYIKMINSRNT